MDSHRGQGASKLTMVKRSIQRFRPRIVAPIIPPAAQGAWGGKRATIGVITAKVPRVVAVRRVRHATDLGITSISTSTTWWPKSARRARTTMESAFFGSPDFERTFGEEAFLTDITSLESDGPNGLRDAVSHKPQYSSPQGWVGVGEPAKS